MRYLCITLFLILLTSSLVCVDVNGIHVVSRNHKLGESSQSQDRDTTNHADGPLLARVGMPNILQKLFKKKQDTTEAPLTVVQKTDQDNKDPTKVLWMKQGYKTECPPVSCGGEFAVPNYVCQKPIQDLNTFAISYQPAPEADCAKYDKFKPPKYEPCKQHPTCQSCNDLVEYGTCTTAPKCAATFRKVVGQDMKNVCRSGLVCCAGVASAPDFKYPKQTKKCKGETTGKDGKCAPVYSCPKKTKADSFVITTAELATAGYTTCKNGEACCVPL